ncbi:MAG: hypothetical protein OEV93_03910 [Candidatus Moranbacteria bacterium]|nr:hypothetical protein [Candidatus Moranbacteria bacterium]
MKKEIEKINLKKLLVENKKDITLVLCAVALGIFYGWSNMEVIIFALFVSSILKPVPMRFFAAIALFFLILTPVLLILERNLRAEEFAVYSYYFLIMTVIMGLIEIRKDKK